MNQLEKFKLAWSSSYKINKLRERIFSILKPKQKSKIIFIFGCQRSGTTIIQKLMGLSPVVKFYGEGDPPYFFDSKGEKHHRIRPVTEVEEHLKKEVFSHILLKPLYESQWANKLISNNSDSLGVWVFRNYLDVIDSHIHYYKQNAFDYIRPLFTQNSKSWLNELITDEDKSFIKQFSLNEISEADAYGIFWIVRNSLFQHVEKNSRILLINYENLVENPAKDTARLYDFIGLPFKNHYSNLIRSGAVSKKITFQLDPKIEAKCKKIYDNLLCISQ